MNFNKYHKYVIDMAFQIFSECGDDAYAEILHDPKLFKAYKQIEKRVAPIPVKRKRISSHDSDSVKMGNLTSKDILGDKN